MVRCKDLKDADDDWSFESEPWIIIVERMNAETQAVEQWHVKNRSRSTSIPLESSEKIVNNELLEVMKGIGKVTRTNCSGRSCFMPGVTDECMEMRQSFDTLETLKSFCKC